MATLNEFTNKTGSNNLNLELPREERQKIIFGADCDYTFTIENISIEDLTKVYVIFKQGDLVYKIKTSDTGDVTLNAADDNVEVHTSLSSTETKELDKLSNLNICAQLKYESDGRVVYHKRIRLITINTLDNQ